ncbi:hypothetical protein [Teredinibacter sp. KSP-S5-2]|uniref:hypothetical protein n=1 Tax=Teredinibacter sp. KSP-S5-2 TaxID=3034506 RepID=UPI002934D11D|nr:hypothetical protein [Teredinibacter sp. KSP-S5-2]WNO11600.1 hypothetical protein P5V12_10500 [Teredinibacter sp. KSP-S5-2]
MTPSELQNHSSLLSWSGATSFYIKRDDLINEGFACSKVRVARRLIDDAIKIKCDSIFCTALSGSSMVSTLSRMTKEHGMKMFAFVKMQNYSNSAHKKVQYSLENGCNFIISESNESLRHDSLNVAKAINRIKGKGYKPYQTQFSGSGPIAIEAYIQAGLELAKQLRENSIESNNCLIYVPAATGTLAFGVGLGLMLSGSKAKLVCCGLCKVGYAELRSLIGHLESIRSQLSLPVDWLRKLLARNEFRNIWEDSPFSIPDSSICVKLRRYENNISSKFDEVYTSKAFMRVILDGERELIKNRDVVFWMTGSEIDSGEYPVLDATNALLVN